MPRYALLRERAVLRITGADNKTFLQGLVSNDVARVTADTAQWAAFLTPQGKYLFDFSISQLDDVLYLDAEADRAPDLAKRFAMYKLRSKADVETTKAWSVAACFGDGAVEAFSLKPETPGRAMPFADGVAFVDPRLARAGVRIVAPTKSIAPVMAAWGFALATAEDYDAHRLDLGLPDGARDLVVEKSTLMESGFDELHAIDWDKGCYMGQELTARTRYRGLVKKRLVPVTVAGPLPDPGTQIVDADGTDAGEVRSGRGARAMALLRLDKLGGTLKAGAAVIKPDVPAWMRLPEPAD